jgi:hypothetical protein
MAKGGRRPGAGRKPGKKLPKTLEREKTLEAYRQRVLKLADKLLDKQLVLANGQQFLYKIEKEWIKTGAGEKAGYWRGKKPELVENESEIREYLEHFVEEANGDPEDDQDPSATYYFITTKEPDSRTLDSIFDRTFGRSTQAVEIGGKDGKPLEISIAKEIADKNGL